MRFVPLSLSVSRRRHPWYLTQACSINLLLVRFLAGRTGRHHQFHDCRRARLPGLHHGRSDRRRRSLEHFCGAHICRRPSSAWHCGSTLPVVVDAEPYHARHGLLPGEVQVDLFFAVGQSCSGKMEALGCTWGLRNDERFVSRDFVLVSSVNHLGSSSDDISGAATAGRNFVVVWSLG
jgi:hypothetical protein